MSTAQGAEIERGHLEGREARAHGRQAAAAGRQVQPRARRLLLHERFANDARRQALTELKRAGIARGRRGGNAAPAARERAADSNLVSAAARRGPTTRRRRGPGDVSRTSRRGSPRTAARASTRSGPAAKSCWAPSDSCSRRATAPALHYRHLATNVVRALRRGDALEDLLLARARGYVVSRADPAWGGPLLCRAGGSLVIGSSRRRSRARRRAPSAGPSPTPSSRGDDVSVASSTCPWATAA